MESKDPDKTTANDTDDSGCVEDAVIPDDYKGQAQLLDLSDDVLLLILKHLAPQDLKALGHTCPRLGSLICDRTLWTAVDYRGAGPAGQKRVGWLLTHCLNTSTHELKIKGFVKSSGQRCMGLSPNCGDPDDDSGQITVSRLWPYWPDNIEELKEAVKKEFARLTQSCKSGTSTNENENLSVNDSDQNPENPAKISNDTAKVSSDLATISGDSAKISGDPATISGDSAKISNDTAKTAGDPAKISDDTAKTAGDPAKISDDTDKRSDDTAKRSNDTAKASGDTAKTSGETAKTSDDTSKTSGDTAKTSGDPAKTSGDTVKTSGDTVKTSDDTAKTSDEDASVTNKNSAKSAQNPGSSGSSNPAPGNTNTNSGRPIRRSAAFTTAPSTSAFRRLNPGLNSNILREIDCNGPVIVWTSQMLRELRFRCPELTSLSLEYCDIDFQHTRIPQFPPRLTKMSLKGTRLFNIQSYGSFLSKVNDKLPHLEYVDLSECDWFEPGGIMPLSKLPKLKYLYLRNCSRLTECVAYASLAGRYGFRQLRELDVRESMLSDSEISALGWLPVLEKLWASPRVKSPAPVHTHGVTDPLDYQELDDWEIDEPDYYKYKERDPVPTEDIDVVDEQETYSGNFGEAWPIESSQIIVIPGPTSNRRGDPDNRDEGFPMNLTTGNNIVISHIPRVNIVNLGPGLGEIRTVVNECIQRSIKRQMESGSSENESESDDDGESREKKQRIDQYSESEDDSEWDEEEQSVEKRKQVEPNTSRGGDEHLMKNGENSNKGEPEAKKPKIECCKLSIENAEPQQSASGYDNNEEPQLDTSDNENNEQPQPSTSKYGYNEDPQPSTSKCDYDDEPQPSTSGRGNNRRNGETIGHVHFRNMSDNNLVLDVPEMPTSPNSSGGRTRAVPIRVITNAEGDVNIAELLKTRIFTTQGENQRDPIPIRVPNWNSIFQPRIRGTDLVTDSAIMRFGRSNNVNVNYVDFGRSNQVPADSDDRSERSSLRFLSLTGYRNITDISLTHLSMAAPDLMTIDFSHTGVTAKGVRRFKAYRPGSKVVFSRYPR